MSAGVEGQISTENSRTIAYFALKYTDRRLSTIGRGGNDCRMISRLGGEMRLKMLSSGAEPRLLSARSSSSDGLFPGAKSHLSSFICKTRLAMKSAKTELRTLSRMAAQWVDPT